MLQLFICHNNWRVEIFYTELVTVDAVEVKVSREVLPQVEIPD